MRRFHLDRFDTTLLVVLIITFVAVAHFPYLPTRLGTEGDPWSTWTFDSGARGLAAAIKGERSWTDLDIHRLPGAVLYYTGAYLFLPTDASDHAHWLAVVYWNMLWLAISVLLLRRAGECLATPLAGKIAVIIAALSPFTVYYALAIQAEVPAYVGATLTAYGATKWLKSEERARLSKYLVIATMGLSLMVLSRTNVVILFPIMFFAALICRRNWLRPSEARFIASCAVCTILVLALVTGLLRFLPRSRPSAQSDNLIYVAFQGRFQFRSETWDWRFWQDYPDRKDYKAYTNFLQQLKSESLTSGISLSKLQLSWIMEDIREHPIINFKMAAVRVLSIHITLVGSTDPANFRIGPCRGPRAYWMFHVLLNSVNFMIYVLSLLFIYLHRRQIWSYWSLWGPWVALVIFHAVVYAEPRYLMPARPGLMLMSSVTIAGFIESGYLFCSWQGKGREKVLIDIA